jgi:hypothetical protein
MRYSFIYYAFHLSFSAFTAAMGPGWEGTPMRMQFDLNTVPQMELTAAREFGCEEGTPMRMQFDLNTVPQMEFPPEQRGHRDSQASSSAATDLRVDTEESFNLYDWAFLQGDPKKKDKAKNQEEFLKHLNQLKWKDVEDFFFIHRDQAKIFMKRYAGSKSKSKFPGANVNFHTKSVKNYDVLLAISNKKINLGRHKFFSSELMEDMKKLPISHHKTKNLNSKPLNDLLKKSPKSLIS